MTVYKLQDECLSDKNENIEVDSENEEDSGVEGMLSSAYLDLPSTEVPTTPADRILCSKRKLNSVVLVYMRGIYVYWCLL